MGKILPAALLVVLIFVGFCLVGTAPLGIAQNSTSVNGILNSDTTWTKANSPYILTGLVGVASGVTLTIEPGVIVNLGEYSLQVGGTLQARGGSGANNITFISKTAAYGNIAFMNGSVGWDDQKRSGSIIENAILSSTSISMNNVSPKIFNSTITGNINIDFGAQPLISKNIIYGDIGVHNSSPRIEHNSIVGGINIGGDSPVILRNIIEGGGVAGIGISFDGVYNIDVVGNTIYGCSTGINGLGMATIAGNLVIDNNQGIVLSSSRIQIQNNTIADNYVGIKIRYDAVPVGRNKIIQSVLPITHNNFENNTQNNIYLEDTQSDVDATVNWWGTVDTQLINLTIHDRKNEPKLGVVSFIPTLSDPVPEAPTTAYTPITTSPPKSQDSTKTQDQLQTQNTGQTGIYIIAVAAIVLSVVINISLAIIITVLLRKKR